MIELICQHQLYKYDAIYHSLTDKQAVLAKMTAQCTLYMGSLKIFRKSPWLRLQLLYPTFFIGFCSDQPYERSYKIWSP